MSLLFLRIHLQWVNVLSLFVLSLFVPYLFAPYLFVPYLFVPFLKMIKIIALIPISMG